MRTLLRDFFTFRHPNNKTMFVKAMLFTAFSSVCTGLLAMFLSGSIKISLGVSSFELLIKIFMYYTFETGWEHIHRKV